MPRRTRSGSSRKSKRAISAQTATARNNNNNKQRQDDDNNLDPVYGRHPPQPDSDGYFRYRRGRVSPKPRLLNTFLLAPIIFAGFGSGTCTMLLLKGLELVRADLVDWTNPVHVSIALIGSAIFTVSMYYLGCRSFEWEFYDSEEARQNSVEWKCKPNMWLDPELRREEVLWGCINAAFGAICGMALFALQQHPRTPPGTVKIYYSLQDPLYGRLTSFGGGWPYFFLSSILFFIGADIWAYLSHRFLHTPFVYQNVHKWHHRYKAVSPFGAYAMHPAEFFLITIGFQGIVFFMPVHISALALNLVYVGYHAIIDHSGIDFDGWFVFSPSAMYHDDHHTHFHCNFGQSLVLWDYLGGTLRTEKRKYGADIFH